MAIECAICRETRDLPKDFNVWPQFEKGKVDIYPVIKKNKPVNQLLGYICAGCLWKTGGYRSQVPWLMQGIIVTDHAIERFQQRSKGPVMTDKLARRVILKLYSQSGPIRFTSGKMIRRLFNNNLEEIEYSYFKGFVFVTTKTDPVVIKTVERMEGKLNRDFWYM